MLVLLYIIDRNVVCVIFCVIMLCCVCASFHAFCAHFFHTGVSHDVDCVAVLKKYISPFSST